MKLTLNQCSALFNAHKALDGYDRVVSAEGVDRVVRQAYNLPFELQLTIAENAETLEKVLGVFNKSRDALFKKHANGADKLEPGTQSLSAFVEEVNELTNTEVEVELKPINFELFSKQDNPFPPSVLSTLLLLRKSE